MKTNQHFTPTPWLRGHSMDGSKITFSHPCSALTPIADVWVGGVGAEEAKANADLLASAPDLLAALQAFMAHVDIDSLVLKTGDGIHTFKGSVLADHARAAIAKATGQNS